VGRGACGELEGAALLARDGDGRLVFRSRQRRSGNRVNITDPKSHVAFR